MTSAGGLSVGSVHLEAEIQLEGSQAANQGSEADTKGPRLADCHACCHMWMPGGDMEAPPLVLFLDSALRMSLWTGPDVSLYFSLINRDHECNSFR